jgi:hypothetical protein
MSGYDREEGRGERTAKSEPGRPPQRPGPPTAIPARRQRAARPHNQRTDITTEKGQHAVTSHIDAATEAVSENIGAWAPENALDLDAFLEGLPRLFEAVAASVAGVAERLGSEFPVDPSVPEHLQEIAATVAGMGEFAGEAHAIHRIAHAAEMDRIENPRPNEELWDVVENQ